METKQLTEKKLIGSDAVEIAADQWFQLLLETIQSRDVRPEVKKGINANNTK